MTVEQLIAVLQKMPQDSEIMMKLRLGSGAEYIRRVTSVVNCGEVVLLRYIYEETEKAAGEDAAICGGLSERT